MELKQHESLQEQQSQLEQLQNQFMGLATTIGTVLTPLLEGLLPILNFLLFPVEAIAEGFRFFADNLALAIPLAAALGIAFAPALISAISSAVGFIMSTFAMIPLGLGIPLGIAAVAGLFSMISKAKSVSQTGDLMIDPNGGPIVSSPREGGLFQGTKNDGLIMAPNVGDMVSEANTSKSDLVVQSAGGGGGADVSKLMDPLTKLYQEMSAMRNDLVSGKVRTHTDSDNVTAKVARTADKSTRNNFAFGKNIV